MRQTGTICQAPTLRLDALAPPSLNKSLTRAGGASVTATVFGKTLAAVLDARRSTKIALYNLASQDILLVALSQSVRVDVKENQGQCGDRPDIGEGNYKGFAAES